MSKHPMVIKAARELCKRASNDCNVIEQDNWAIYGEDFIADAEAMLNAAGAPDLLQALEGLLSLDEDLSADGADAALKAARAALAAYQQAQQARELSDAELDELMPTPDAGAAAVADQLMARVHVVWTCFSRDAVRAAMRAAIKAAAAAKGE